MVFLELLSTLTQQVEQGCGEDIVEREKDGGGESRTSGNASHIKLGRATWGSVPQRAR